MAVGAASGTYGTNSSSLAFDPSTNQPYVAYTDLTFGPTKATVMRFDGVQWVTVGPPAGSSTSNVENGDISLAFNPSTHQPYVAYEDVDGSKVTVKRFDGTSWITVGTAAFTEEADHISLAFDPAASQPYVAYTDWSNGFKGTVMRFDGTNWVAVGAAFSPLQAGEPSLAFNPYLDIPYVAYADSANNFRATVMRFDGANWVAVGPVGFTASSARDISLAFDLVTSQPYVAYTGRANLFKASVMKFEPFGQSQVAPKIVRAETFREGVMVFFRLFFSDPNNDATEFGFRGINGSGWAEETHPFSNPGYGRVFPGRVEYPFNHLCGTGSEYESDVEAWIDDSYGLRSPSVTVHLACTAPSVPPSARRGFAGKRRQ